MRQKMFGPKKCVTSLRAPLTCDAVIF